LPYKFLKGAVFMGKIKKSLKNAWNFVKDEQNQKTLVAISPLLLAGGWYVTRIFEATCRFLKRR
jgi:hypothetical protein